MADPAREGEDRDREQGGDDAVEKGREHGWPVGRGGTGEALR
jgi:hypothetical protein